MVKKKSEDLTSWKDIPKILLTFALVCFGYLLFRATDLKELFEIIYQISFSDCLNDTPLKTNSHFIFLFKAIFGIIFMIFFELKLLQSNKIYFILIVLFLLLFLGSFRNSISFIYFQF
jgi:hypothetical protein